jgi:hypothetical protein
LLEQGPRQEVAQQARKILQVMEWMLYSAIVHIGLVISSQKYSEFKADLFQTGARSEGRSQLRAGVCVTGLPSHRTADHILFLSKWWTINFTEMYYFQASCSSPGICDSLP